MIYSILSFYATYYRIVGKIATANTVKGFTRAKLTIMVVKQLAIINFLITSLHTNKLTIESSSNSYEEMTPIRTLTIKTRK